MKTITKGTQVRLQTTNGGEILVKLAHDYRPTFATAFITDYGYAFTVEPERIKSVEPVEQLDLFLEFARPPMSYAEMLAERAALPKVDQQLPNNMNLFDL